jgi:hypothetical protein
MRDALIIRDLERLRAVLRDTQHVLETRAVLLVETDAAVLEGGLRDDERSSALWARCVEHQRDTQARLVRFQRCRARVGAALGRIEAAVSCLDSVGDSPERRPSFAAVADQLLAFTSLLKVE